MAGIILKPGMFEAMLKKKSLTPGPSAPVGSVGSVSQEPAPSIPEVQTSKVTAPEVAPKIESKVSSALTTLARAAPPPAMPTLPVVMDETPEPSSPERFKKALLKLEEFCKVEFDAVSLAMTRDTVKRIVLELREFPEYAGIINDGDIRNFFIFLRKTATNAKLGQEKAKTKQTAKAAGKIRVDDAVFALDMPTGLADLGSMSTDDIAATLGIKRK